MDEESAPQPTPGRPSQVPSWVMLGFILGALFVLALPRRSPVEPEPRPAREAPAARAAVAAESPQVTTIEAVFDSWDRYAVWSNDTTEVALWNSQTKGFTDCYEVLRVDDAYYFRTIPRLTRPILEHGVVEGSPLQFTETARQRSEWLSEVGKENLRALSGSVREQFGTPTREPPTK